MCGIANEKWQRLLAEDKLTYDKAYKLLLSLEASEKQVKDLAHPEATCVHQLHPSRQSSTPTPATKRKPPCKPIPKDKALLFYSCGGENNSDKYRFKEAECRYCPKMGHIASACRKKQRAAQTKSTYIVIEQNVDATNEYSLPIDCTTTPHSKPLMVTMCINAIPGRWRWTLGPLSH